MGAWIRAWLAFALAGSMVAGCTGDDASPGTDAGLADGSVGDAGPPRSSDDELATMRESCVFDRGALPAATVGKEFPIGEDIPIDHFILLMQENRSFDSYFGTMPGVDGIPAGATNPDADMTPIAPFHATEYCIDDVAHSWGSSHEEYDDGANDGFVIANNPNGARAMGYLDDTDLPFYWDLYSTFAMSDRHFCSVLSSTWTNRWYYLAATSFGRTSNDILPQSVYDGFGGEAYNMMMRLDEAGLDWRVYNHDGPEFLVLFPSYGASHLSHVVSIGQFYRDLEDGKLPPVTWLDPAFFSGVEQSDEHPPADPQMGQAFVAQVVDAVIHSPLWASTALIVTYDEHGGFYDHVPPPEACPPDDFPAADSDGVPRTEGGYDRYGFRVPLVVVSPYAKRGYVSHRVTDHTSILRLVEARFGLPALTARDANAWPLLDMFDFDNPPNMNPPDLAEAIVDPDQLDACRPFLE